VTARRGTGFRAARVRAARAAAPGFTAARSGARRFTTAGSGTGGRGPDGLSAAWLGVAGLGAAALLRSSFAARAGSARFYALTTSLAATWTSGALGAGPIPWRGDGWRSRPGGAVQALVVVPVATGAATFGLFYGAARVARRYPVLHRAIASVLRYADAGSTPAVVLIASSSGVAEELYFRGALWSGPRPLATTTLAYAASTAAAGNPVLVLAGLITSVIFGWQRAATGGVLAPAVTHVTWSVLMLRFLTPLFLDADPAQAPGGAAAGSEGRGVDDPLDHGVLLGGGQIAEGTAGQQGGDAVHGGPGDVLGSRPGRRRDGA
jgi:membrane protease YdiL (CAAX protease family)